jgi:hypothetical protein
VVSLVDDEAAHAKPAGGLLSEDGARQAGADDDQVVVLREALQAGHAARGARLTGAGSVRGRCHSANAGAAAESAVCGAAAPRQGHAPARQAAARGDLRRQRLRRGERN